MILFLGYYVCELIYIYILFIDGKVIFYIINIIITCKIYFTHKYVINFNCCEQTRYFNISTNLMSLVQIIFILLNTHE